MRTNVYACCASDERGTIVDFMSYESVYCIGI